MMGTFVWIIRQELRCSDGVAIGRLKAYKPFAPWTSLILRNCGIFRDTQIDLEGADIDTVYWVDTPNDSAPGFFQVDLTEEDTPLPYHEARTLYGSHFEWTFTPHETKP